MTITTPTDGNRVETEWRTCERHIDLHSVYDQLTQIPNRHSAHESFMKAIAGARESGGRIALFFLDLDRFKNVNASFGYRVGDGLLLEVARRLRDVMGEGHVVARFSGDKFILLLERIEDQEKASAVARDISAVARDILQGLAKPVEVEGREFFVSASLGVSLFPDDSVDGGGLLMAAEAAMYRAKEMGRNNYQFYTPDLNARSRELLGLEYDLRRALDRGELIVHYQPQFELGSRRIVGTEALVRWQDPQRGLVSPADFIPLAEETGLIVPIGEWVLRTACAQNRAWQDAGYPKVPVAVNLSARQFLQPDLVQMVARILEETRLEPSFLELEITETTVMKDMESAISVMGELGRMGVKLAIDDFGSGYSSLSYLKRFPVDKVKIDRSFICNINTVKNDATIASSMIALCHSMDLGVIAEGIETEEQARILVEEGCEHGQGYLFSRPLSVEEFGELFRLAA